MLAFFFAPPTAPPAPLAFELDAPPPGKGRSSRGTMSIRKSNWSDLLSAFAISARDRVRRLFESAIMNARAVISDMKTTARRVRMLSLSEIGIYTYSRRPCRTKSVLEANNR